MWRNGLPFHCWDQRLKQLCKLGLLHLLHLSLILLRSWFSHWKREDEILVKVREREKDFGLLLWMSGWLCVRNVKSRNFILIISIDRTWGNCGSTFKLVIPCNCIWTEFCIIYNLNPQIDNPKFKLIMIHWLIIITKNKENKSHHLMHINFENFVFYGSCF